MLDSTNLFLDPESILDERSCFESIHELDSQMKGLSSLDILNISKGLYVWGTEEVSRRIMDLLIEVNIPILGVFDSNAQKHGKLFRGFVIQPPRNKGKLVIVASYHQPEHLQEARNLLGELAIGAWEFLILNRESKALPWNNLRTPDALTREEKNHLGRIAQRCSDETRAEFWRQVAARHFVSILHPNKIGCLSAQEEYFVDGLIETRNDSVFLDLGAYNGDTIDRYFAQKVELPDKRKAIGLEADQQNFSILLNKFHSRSEIKLINAVIGQKCGIMEFAQSENSMGSSALFFEPNTYLPSVTIDEISNHQIFTHVKFDIEGFERIALAGAEKSISLSNAIWSVASYHLADDFWTLPEFFPSSYELVVTRHAPLPWDTTMHFIPKK